MCASWRSYWLECYTFEVHKTATLILENTFKSKSAPSAILFISETFVFALVQTFGFRGDLSFTFFHFVVPSQDVVNIRHEDAKSSVLCGAVVHAFIVLAALASTITDSSA